MFILGLGTACIVKGSYCQCHYCKCEHGHIHCKGHGHGGGYGKNQNQTTNSSLLDKMKQFVGKIFGLGSKKGLSNQKKPNAQGIGMKNLFFKMSISIYHDLYRCFKASEFLICISRWSYLYNLILFR